jgi:hypothetical protein
MNKYSIIAIILAVVIGVGVGWFSKTQQSNKAILQLQKQHELELVQQNKLAREHILQLDNTILELKKLNSKDSITISELKYKIKENGVVVKQKLEEVQKLNSDEKVEWLYNRYRN